MTPVTHAPAWLWWAACMTLAVMTVAVYANSLSNGFVSWDDSDYIYQNPFLLNRSMGLKDIWLDLFKTKPHEQYYPMVFTSFWIEYQLNERFTSTEDGLSPWLYHFNQMLLHAAVGAVMLMTLRQLGFSLFTILFTAAFFIVHPVNVASVAWVTERKNTLSGLFFWLSLLSYVHYRRVGHPALYAAALLAFLLGLFSKTAIIVLAPLIVLTDRMLDRRWTPQSLLRSIPFFVVGLIMISVTIHVEGVQGKSGVPIAVWLRPFVACAALVHYVWKLIVPVGLLPLYPRWSETIDPTVEPRYLISAVLVAAAAAAFIRYRRRLGDQSLWAAGVFVLTLFPMLGLKHFNFMQYSFVSDHYMYLTAPAFFILVGLWLDRWAGISTSLFTAGGKVPAQADPAEHGRGDPADSAHADAGFASGPQNPDALRRIVIYAVSILLLILCGLLTIRQNHVWEGPVTFWEHTLTGNPDCFPANFNLGNHYMRQNPPRPELAIPYYKEAARVLPTHINTRRKVAQLSARLNLTDQAIDYYRQACQVAETRDPPHLEVHFEFADYLIKLGRMQEATQLHDAVAGLIQREQKRGASRREAFLKKYLPSLDDLARRLNVSGVRSGPAG